MKQEKAQLQRLKFLGTKKLPVLKNVFVRDLLPDGYVTFSSVLQVHITNNFKKQVFPLLPDYFENPLTEDIDVFEVLQGMYDTGVFLIEVNDRPLSVDLLLKYILGILALEEKDNLFKKIMKGTVCMFYAQGVESTLIVTMQLQERGVIELDSRRFNQYLIKNPVGSLVISTPKQETSIPMGLKHI